jgi:hypothetical protein
MMEDELPTTGRVAESVRRALQLVGPSETAPYAEEDAAREDLVSQ